LKLRNIALPFSQLLFHWRTKATMAGNRRRTLHSFDSANIVISAVAFPAAVSGALCHGRWRAEQPFRRLKHRLGLGHMSGLSWHAAKQDFGAKAVFATTSMRWAPMPRLRQIWAPDSDWSNLLIDNIKRQIGRWLLAAGATTSRLRLLIQEVAANLQKFFAGRSQPRMPQRKPARSHAYTPI
jgi:hypothetical protein